MSLPEHALVGLPVYVLWFTDKTQQLRFLQERGVLGIDIPVAQSAAVAQGGEVRRWGGGGGGGFTPEARSGVRAQTGPAGCQ